MGSKDVIETFPPPSASGGQKEFSSTVLARCRSNAPFQGMTCKALILGDAGVGKTALAVRFVTSLYDSNYKATVGVDFYVHKFDILEKPFSLQIWDTAGQERFLSVAKNYFRKCNVVILAFDLSQPNSLDSVRHWLDLVVAENPKKAFQTFLVGLKKDLNTGPLATLTTESGVRVARELNAEYWEASSKLDDGVTAFFCRVAAVTFDAMMLKQMAAETEGGVTPIGSPAPRRKNIRLDEPPAESSGCKC
eukprot:m.846562 g.846562  ORF g.846562 m.846562 type:complete len:249 (+) comp59562_c0_seq2:124-870(+)